MKVKILVIGFSFLLGLQAFAGRNMSCSDPWSGAGYGYSYTFRTPNRGTPPRQGDEESTEKWNYYGKTVYEETKYIGLPPKITMSDLTATFDESSKMLLSGDPFNYGRTAYSRTFAVKVTLTSSKLLPKGPISQFVICAEGYRGGAP